MSQAIVSAAGLVTALTGIGVLVGCVAPRLAGQTSPHPVLNASVADAVSILANNLRVLAAPFLLTLTGIAHTRTGRVIGDIALLILTATSTLTVGVALGAWQVRLIPYVPQLPIEWAALAVSISAWLLTRNQRAARRQLIPLAAIAVVLITIAAALETWCTPQRLEIQTATRRAVDTPVESTVSAGVGGCFSDGACAAFGHPLQGHTFPSPSPGSVPLGRIGRR